MPVIALIQVTENATTVAMVTEDSMTAKVAAAMEDVVPEATHLDPSLITDWS